MGVQLLIVYGDLPKTRWKGNRPVYPLVVGPYLKYAPKYDMGNQL